ncbi:hypothetical protein ONJ16_26395, partial [Salmonella enterica subsp. enterica serovar Montevideo]|nr:hypothetical protein [Salmonella enterica subsp. enterica serovar Montevideo]
RFHNYLYEALDLNYLYKAFSPTDLTQAISGVRGLGIRGCAISTSEFSFLLAVPMMMGATVLDLYKSWSFLTAADIPMFAVGFVTA